MRHISTSWAELNESSRWDLYGRVAPSPRKFSSGLAQRRQIPISACQDVTGSIKMTLLLSSFDFEALGVTKPDPWSGFQARSFTDLELKNSADIMQRSWWDFF